MFEILSSFEIALGLITHADAELWGIVWLSIELSVVAAVIGGAMGLPLGAIVGIARFPGRRALIVVLNAMLGLPSVVVGLVFYLLLSRAGPLGEWGLLFTPKAIVIAQAALVVPIVAALTRQVIEDAWAEYAEQMRSLGVGTARAVRTLLWDTRFTLFTVGLAGFGRAASEVGAVMVVGGNIDGVTRVMTTAIALETSKGDLPLALGLGVILIGIVLAVNAAAYGIREWSARRHG